MAFAAWAEENPSEIYQNPPWALAGRPQISPELAGRAPDLRNLGNLRKTPRGGKSVPPGQGTEKISVLFPRLIEVRGGRGGPGRFQTSRLRLDV